MDAPEPLSKNAILAQLPARELANVERRGEIVDAEIGEQVYEPGRPINDVYFPLTSVFSLVALADERILIEVATVGHEGMVGLPLFLGARSSPHASFCQVPGQAVRLEADALRAVLTDDGVLHHALNRATQATMVQVAQNVVCNNSHPLEQRAARWLLTTHDRVQRDEFHLTQDFLAQMLGTRRPTVSEIAQRLQDRNLISYSRGIMHISDRAGLEATTCQCYAVVRNEYDAIFRGE